MTAKKSASKPKAAKKAPEVEESQTVVQDAPELEGEAYQAGFHGVSSDEEDYSVAAQVAKLAGE